MKNPLFHILTILGAVCACVCIVLIVVIVLTGNNRAHENTAGETVPAPERFKQLADTVAPASELPAEQTPSLPIEQFSDEPGYTGRFTCKAVVPADTLKKLLTQHNLFCEKSPWSKHWAHPTGKGIRLRQEGLAFTDSIVTDSLTHRMWQRYATFTKLNYNDIDSAIAGLNASAWQGHRDWRPPTVEELMVLLTPGKNRHGLHLPGPWDGNARDFWSCNPAVDSLTVKWIWVVRTEFGRCNYGDPFMPRALLAVRQY